jgi:hypothetical protein
MNKIKKTLAGVAASLGLGGALALAPVAVLPAHAYTPPYHIRNSSGSTIYDNVRIYADFGCGGSTHDLYPGQEANSVNWDGIRAWRRYEVTIYDDKDGSYITSRRYNAGVCSRAEGNIYLVTIFGGSLVW